MRHLGRIMDRGPRRIALLGAIVLLPAAALGLLAFRAFRGEQVRDEYQRRERQQQILRLLESDLTNWILSRREDAAGNRFAFEVRQNRILLPHLKVYLSTDHQREAAIRLSARDSTLWREAESIEFRDSETTAAVNSYRTLLSGNPTISSWSRLALLRLSLRRAGSADAAVWLGEIQAKDQAAVTESGTPIWVAAALLLIGRHGLGSTQENVEFLTSTLSQLASGRWHLNAAQWIYYAREICPALNSTPDLRSGTLATAEFLESLAGAVHEVVALDQSLEWHGAQPFVARYIPGLHSVLVLFPGQERNTGRLLAGDEMVRESEARLDALTAAEDFEGRIRISGGDTQPTGLSLPAFPFLQTSFIQKEQTLWRSHKRRYAIFYATALLLLSAGAGLVFTYRAVVREIGLSRMKTDFVSSVSHEFRTPLAAIEALLERLESGKVKDEQMLHRYYLASRREVQRLTGMVTQLLDFARLEEGRAQLSLETLDLNRLAEEAIQSFRNLGFGARLTDALNREGPLTISADKDAAYQCIHNLIDNALKYSPDGSQVTIGSGRRDREVFLQVSDHGPGIAPQDQPLVFEQFYRAGSAGARGVRGTGIGLALVKRLMRAHGGAVTLESLMGEGSTFQLTFPEGKA